MKASFKIMVLVFLNISFFLGGCKKKTKLDYSLELSDKNSVELKKVLNHFNKNTESLKYKSALFLIENMPGKFHYKANYLDAIAPIYDSIKDISILQKRKERSDLMVDSILRSGFAEPLIIQDLTSINSTYLIKHIEQSVENYQNSKWFNQISEDDFLNYLLPYKADNESFENWIDSVKIFI